MPAWDQLLRELNSLNSNEEKNHWLNTKLNESLSKISILRNETNVLFYSTAFLQKPTSHPNLQQITSEDVNGFMSIVYGMTCQKGLTLLLHTPGGQTNATESIVEYLHQKFNYIEVIIPTFAMSAGTMISLSSNKIIMGRHSQLGPIDPQMFHKGSYISARAVVNQFETAKKEIQGNLDLAHLWSPILGSLGPSLYMEAQNALAYGERMVGNWLEKRMFYNLQDKSNKSATIAKYFNDSDAHKSHGRRIDINELTNQGLITKRLEDNQDLQEEVLTAYHLMTITFEHSLVAKMIINNHDRRWIKNWVPPQNTSNTNN